MIKKRTRALLLTLLVACTAMTMFFFSRDTNVFAAPAVEEGPPPRLVLLGAQRAGGAVVPQLDYTIGDSLGTVPLNGAVYNYPPADMLARFDAPEGEAFVWVYDDLDSVYLICDWTGGGRDGAAFCTALVDDGAGVKAYTQRFGEGGGYGAALYAKTGMAGYEHMYYILAIPKAGLRGGALKVGLKLYGPVVANQENT